MKEREYEKDVRSVSDEEFLSEERPRRSRRGMDMEETESMSERESEDQTEEPEAPAPRKRSPFSRYLMTVLSGNILSRAEVRRVYPYLLFVAFLMLLYISNVFRMQQLYRRHDRLAKEVKELRAKSMTIASEKMSATRQSRILEQVKERGIPLRESLTPNKVITE